MVTRKQTEVKGKIEFEHLGIGTVLSRNRFVVPVNQREYSWKDKNVLALLQDFTNAIRQGKSSYFLGTIVLTAGEEDAPEVADGQQRLATTTILLAAIRDYLFEKRDARRVHTLEESYLFKTPIETNEMLPRLKLNLDDNDFFIKRILSSPDNPDRSISPTKPSHQKIEVAAKLAAKHIKDILQPLSESNRVSYLIDWIKFIEDTAQVIVLRVPDDLNAFIMFETLNDRGLRTSQTDLVKNYLFGQAEERIEEAQQRWAKMVGILETLDVEDIALEYLRHLLSSMHGLTTERQIFETIKNNIGGRGETIAFLGTLADQANDYVAILNPEHSKWNTYNPSIRHSIRTMNSLRAVPLRHLMLPIARNFAPREAEKAFRLFVSWAVRFLVTGGGRGGTLEGAYADRAIEISKGTITTAKKLAEAMSDVVPSDAQFKAEFAVAQVPKSKLARYFLRALELKVKGNPEPEFVPNEDTVINLEHILPENPGRGWGGIDSEIARAVYQRLGNMVLLQASKNTAIGNKSFKEKLPILKASAYFLTSEIAKNAHWGAQEINDRQNSLAELAVKTWPIDVR